MASRFSDEVSAIRKIRTDNPKAPAKTLARRIGSGEFSFIGEGSIQGRPFLSTYSVIRRYDATQKAIKVGGGKSAKKSVLAFGHVD